MKTSKIEVTATGDVVYYNNHGKPFLLSEAKSPIGKETYDIIVAFPGEVDEENDCFRWVSTDVVWWFGAFVLRYYFSDADDSILKDCADFLDEH